METKKIKIVVEEKTTSDGRKFNAFKTFSKNGRAIKVKFRKEVKELPTEKCFIVCNVADMSLNTSGEYPVLWIAAIQKIEAVSEAAAADNAKKINDFFD